jgi:ribosomal protein S18 acetylase RimI-like enzyme
VKAHIRRADREDWPAIVDIAKTSPYTKGVTNPRVVAADTIERGEMAVCEVDDEVVGFVAVRHLVRKPYTSLHYVGVHPEWRSKGIGERLVAWAQRNSPHGTVRLLCEIENKPAHKFYKRLGFERVERGANASGQPYYVYMIKRKPDIRGRIGAS